MLHGLTRREIDDGADRPGLLKAVLSGDLSAVRVPEPALDLDEYVRLAAASGLPEPALRLPRDVRQSWLDSYVEHVVTRDVAAAGQTRDPVRLRRYLETLALSTAGLPADVTLSEAAGIAAQLRPELELLRSRVRLHHLRTDGGRQEVDLMLDLGAGRIVAVQVKAGTAPSRRDARHLVWLRDELGDGFVRGLVLHTGPQPFELDERIWAVPIASLWS